MRVRTLFAPLLGLALFGAAPAHAQLSASVGAGVAQPRGDLDDGFENGFTVRTQLALSALGLVNVHAQAGWTRFGADDTAEVDLDDANVFHAGVGGRLGVLGLAFVGLNGVWFGGDSEDDFGLLPEVGVGLGPLEVVADYRLGDEGWLSLRGALKF